MHLSQLQKFNIELVDGVDFMPTPFYMEGVDIVNTVDKVLSIAEAEVGYLEKASNRDLDSKSKNAGRNNYTKYWRDLSPSLQGNAWCNCFVDWCFYKAYGKTEALKLLCSTSFGFYTPTTASYFKAKGQWHSNPVKGDIIYFKNSTRIHHVGIVYKVDGTRVYTIEGNTSGGTSVVANGGGVFKKSYLLAHPNIAGYGRPNYDSESSKEESSNSETEYHGIVTANELNIRKGPGSSYGIVGKLNKDDTVEIQGATLGWIEVDDGEWVSSNYVDSTKTGTVTASLLNFRDAPSTGNVLAMKTKGTKVKLYALVNGWYITEFGYCSSKYIK